MAAKCDNIMTINTLAGCCKTFKSALSKLIQDGKSPGQKMGKYLWLRKDTIDQQREELIGKIEKQLTHTSSPHPTVAIRWRVR